MKRILFFLLALSAIMLITACSKNDDFDPDNQNSDEIQYDGNRKILVSYFSATGNTGRLAEQIIAATGADAFRIEAAEPYAANPYDDSDWIQNESYNNLRPGVAALLDNMEKYDVIFIGSGGTIRQWWSVRSSRVTISREKSSFRFLLMEPRRICSNLLIRFTRSPRNPFIWTLIRAVAAWRIGCGAFISLNKEIGIWIQVIK